MKRVRLPLAAALTIASVVLLTARARAVFPSPSFADDPQPSSPKKVWVCTPCHDDHDKTEYDKPGVCPICGMPLIEKSEVAKAEAAMAARMKNATERKRVEILVFEGVQIIDFTGPYEVFGQAGFEVVTVAEKAGPLTTNMGMTLTPAFTLENAPKADVIVVPGGNVLEAQASPAVKAWLNKGAEKAEVVLSVCNGAFILAKSGLLDGLSATTFAPLIEGLAVAAPKTKVVSDKRFVDNGKIVTSAGLSSGIDASLHVVEKIYGKGAAQKVAVGLEYNWDPAGRWVRAQLADRFLRNLYRAANDWDRDILSHEGTTTAWENRWRLRTQEPREKVLAGVAEALGVTPKSSGGTETWTFADEKGAPWKGTASVTSDAGSTGAVLLTVHIERAGA